LRVSQSQHEWPNQAIFIEIKRLILTLPCISHWYKWGLADAGYSEDMKWLSSAKWVALKGNEYKLLSRDSFDKMAELLDYQLYCPEIASTHHAGDGT
jgi:hypothetical protein